jgi:hypothetical protein
MVVQGFFEIFAALGAFPANGVRGPRLSPINNKRSKSLISQKLKASLAVETKRKVGWLLEGLGGYLTGLGAGRLAGGNR